MANSHGEEGGGISSRWHYGRGGDVIAVGNKLGDEVVTVGDVVEKSEEVTLLIEGEDIVVEVKEG